MGHSGEVVKWVTLERSLSGSLWRNLYVKNGSSTSALEPGRKLIKSALLVGWQRTWLEENVVLMAILLLLHPLPVAGMSLRAVSSSCLTAIHWT